MKKSLGAKTLAYPAPVWVIGSYDTQGKANIMTASWAGICCSKPPAVYVALRKATYTYGNIMEQKAFSINIPSSKHIKETDYVGQVSGREIDKFAETSLSSEAAKLVNAPCVKEFPLVIECRLLQSVEVGLHTIFIGEILDVQAEESILGENSLPDMNKLRPFVFSPEVGEYHALGDFLGKAFSIGKEL